MAEISFPLNPANNDVYTVNGRYWRWDGVSWNSIINNSYGNLLYNDNGNANTTNAISFSNSTVTINNVEIVEMRSYTEKVTTVGTITANYSVNTSLTSIFDVTLGANNLTLSLVGAPSSGVSKTVTVILRQDSVGTRFVTFANSKYTDAAVPVLSTQANSTDILTFFTVDGGYNWFGSFAMANVG